MKRVLVILVIFGIAGALSVTFTSAGAQGVGVVKIGEIEAQTGPNAIYGWMSSQGLAMAVREINDAGGFQVKGKTYTLQLMAPDTRGDPKEALVHLKRMLEVEQVRYVFGPFLSNVFLTVRPYAQQFNGKFLMMGGATRIHDYIGTPGHDFLIRTWNWDVGPHGFGALMADYAAKNLGMKKVALLLQNDQGGKVMEDIYAELFKQRGIAYRIDYFEPGTKDFSPFLAKIAAWKPDFLFPGYSDSYLYDIVRQATESGLIKKFFLTRGSLGPGLKNENTIDQYIVYVPKYFEEAEKTQPKVRKFIGAYKTFYKRDFPYDQAPLCSSSCYDHVYMLVEAMKRAGTVDDVAAVKRALLGMTYDGLWKLQFDPRGEEIFDFDIVVLKKGGAVQAFHITP